MHEQTEKPIEPEAIDNVVRLDAAMITDLKRRKVMREQADAFNIELSPIGPGETTIGYLTDEERLVFCELTALHAELEEEGKEMAARSLEMVAQSIRTSKTSQDLVDDVNKQPLFPTDEDAETHFANVTRSEYLQAIFAMSLRERYGHSGRYDVRVGYQVVRLGYKHKRPDQFGKVS